MIDVNAHGIPSEGCEPGGPAGGGFVEHAGAAFVKDGGWVDDVNEGSFVLHYSLEGELYG